MPRFYGNSMDVKFGSSQKYKTFDEAIKIRNCSEKSEKANFGRREPSAENVELADKIMQQLQQGN